MAISDRDHVLVTGATGFSGRHFVDGIRRKHPDVEITGTRRLGSADEEMTDIVNSDVSLIPMELMDQGTIEKGLEEVTPTAVLHLAGQTRPETALQSPQDMLQTNIVGTTKLLEAMRRMEMDSLPLVITSPSELYGETELANEEWLPSPLSVFGVSGASSDALAGHYAASYGMPILRLRVAPITGPGQTSQAFVSGLVRQVAEAELGQRDPVIEVSDLEQRIDILDIRDAVGAYTAALNSDIDQGVYNVGPNEAVLVDDLVKNLQELSRRDDLDVQVVGTATGPRVNHIDSSTFRSVTDWQPRIPLDQTLEDLLNYWRGELS